MSTKTYFQRSLLDFEVENDDFDVGSIDFGAMENINFDDVDADLANFQRDEIVKEALAKGMSEY